MGPYCHGCEGICTPLSLVRGASDSAYYDYLLLTPGYTMMVPCFADAAAGSTCLASPTGQLPVDARLPVSCEATAYEGTGALLLELSTPCGNPVIGSGAGSAYYCDNMCSACWILRFIKPGSCCYSFCSKWPTALLTPYFVRMISCCMQEMAFEWVCWSLTVSYKALHISTCCCATTSCIFNTDLPQSAVAAESQWSSASVWPEPAAVPLCLLPPIARPNLPPHIVVRIHHEL